MANRNQVISNINDPHELEKLFREDPDAFKRSFEEALERNAQSQVLAVWHERLNYQEETESEKAGFMNKDFLFMGLMALLAGLTSRGLFHLALEEVITPINLIFGVVPFIAGYFMYRNPPKKPILYTVIGAFFVSIIYLNLLPMEETDSIILAYLHLPIFLWVVTGLAFTGNAYNKGRERLTYLKFNGEFAVIYASMAISGMILTGLTMQLFYFAGLDIADFYFRNVVLFGATGLTVVAAYLVIRNLEYGRHIASYLAKIFSPLVLLTLLAYLIMIVSIGENPFMDRDFLLSFNGVLLLVLALTIFTITGSTSDEKRTVSDVVNSALIFLALIIDTVALSAIVFRLTSYGITPNRLAVLGVNVLIWANLIWIGLAYSRFLTNKTGLTPVQNAVTKYLPVYGLWAAIVTFTFPWIF
ncbi:protein of unknown function [Alkalibacterium putridalgicola]|uniref:DUF4153 domain-containing protein n=1 Tax=Alkalibacterium putridalgicola TaxID=426703 RepID=A0A1H7ULG5_9LACT|nr:DUF4153 domain-containing protein [Alkalibacterium putridalgicola]GEK88241.1 DUF4153 domain-containing protein [Alkalibacterium putridalgicola]SEL97781.1 protein of unknown function [Alkalibacterium putridalgicola]